MHQNPSEKRRMLIKSTRKPKHPCGPPEVIRAKLRNWYAVGLGRQFLDVERAELDSVLANLFGFHLLQVGAYADEYILAATRISHTVLLDYQAHTLSEALQKIAMRGSATALPIASQSVDVVVLHHSLEFSRDPHQVLREVDRVLVAEGHVVILGFNPWSFWLPWRWLLRWSQQPPWCGRALGRARLRDWLSLLGFDIVHSKNHFYRPPLQQAGIMDRLKFMDKLGARFWPRLGAGYLLVGRKKVIALTPIKPRWKPRRSLIPQGVVESQNRERPHGRQVTLRMDATRRAFSSLTRPVGPPSPEKTRERVSWLAFGRLRGGK